MLNPVTPVVEILLQWMLGLVGITIVGIIAGFLDMRIKIAMLIQKVSDHIVHCEELHAKHDRELTEIKSAVRALGEQ